MATEQKPIELPEVEVTAENLNVPQTKSTNTEYASSEQIQRAHAAQVFVQTQQQEEKAQKTQAEKLQETLDAYIEQHSSTVKVRALAKKNERSNSYQMDLSADLVEMLEKIKKSVR